MIEEEEMDLTNAQLLRLKAEERLKVHKQKAEDIIREMDLKRIVHELQVHQIELELQNEELMKAFQIAENALKKYTMLYDLAPVGFFTLDAEGYISELNFTGAELLGDKRFVLIHKNFKLFVADSSKHEFTAFLNNVFASGKKEFCEVTLSYDNKLLGNVYIEGILTSEDGDCLLTVMNLFNLKT